MHQTSCWAWVFFFFSFFWHKVEEVFQGHVDLMFFSFQASTSVIMSCTFTRLSFRRPFFSLSVLGDFPKRCGRSRAFRRGDLAAAHRFQVVPPGERGSA